MRSTDAHGVDGNTRRASGLFNFNETILGPILQTGAYFSHYDVTSLSAKFVTTASITR